MKILPRDTPAAQVLVFDAHIEEAQSNYGRQISYDRQENRHDYRCIGR
jgi:hypothetical protein